MFVTSTDAPGGAVVATIDRDRLDSASVEAFKQGFEAMLPAQGGIIVDLHRVQFVDSVGLGALLFATRRAANSGTPLVFSRLTTVVMALIARVRMDQVIPLAPDPAEAKRMIQKQQDR